MNWNAKTIVHNGTSRIAVYFEKNQELIKRIKLLDDARWSASKNCWHLPDASENRTKFKLPLAHTLLPNKEGIQSIENFKKYLLSKHYSPNTINTYSDALKIFLTFFNKKSVLKITNEDVILYNNEPVGCNY